MPVCHDLICSGCDTIFPDQIVNVDLIRSGQLRHAAHAEYALEIYYGSFIRTPHDSQFHASESSVVWQSDQEGGKIQYPDRNDRPIPERLQRRGYRRVEMRSLREVERFEKSHGVLNERVWFDKGSGRGHEK